MLSTKMVLYIYIYIYIYIYRERERERDLALNNVQWSISHKTQSKPNPI